MKLNFTINPNIDFDTLRNSMQLDSGVTLATLEADGMKITLEVNGNVRVLFNPDPDGKAKDGSVYKTPSDFPEELMRIFKECINTADMKNVFLDDSNWFELFAEKDGTFIDCEIVGEEFTEGFPVPEMFKTMWKFLERVHEQETRRQKLQEALLFFQGKKEKLKEVLKTEEESGVYPHDCITTHTIEMEDGGHQLSVTLKLFSDRDGGEDEPEYEVLVDGYEAASEFADLINEIIGI